MSEVLDLDEIEGIKFLVSFSAQCIRTVLEEQKFPYVCQKPTQSHSCLKLLQSEKKVEPGICDYLSTCRFI